MYTDASFMAGAGFFGRRWFIVKYPEAWHEYGITFLELYPIVVAVSLFGHCLRNKRVVFHTDNQAVVYIINKQTSRSPRLMRLVRQLVLLCLGYNLHFGAVHVPGVSNCMADSLSRLQVTSAMLKERGMNQCPEKIPAQMTPQNWKGK